MSKPAHAAYWLLGDDRLPLGNTPGMETAFKAHFVHSLLFQDSLVLSDSLVCNNRNFRLSVRNDANFRELITSTTLKIAIRRTEQGEMKSLRQINAEFLGRQANGFERAEYDITDELDTLETLATCIPYDLNSLAIMYDEATYTHIFSEFFARQFTDDRNTLAVIRGATLDARQGGKLSRSFFHYDIPRIIQERRGEAFKSQYQELIKAHTDGPYLLALPTLIQASPVYAEPHGNAIDLARGRLELKTEDKADEVFSTELGLSSYVKGLAALPAEAVHTLRETGYAWDLRQQLARYDGSSQNRKSILQLIRLHQLDIERAIIRHFPSLRHESANGNERRASLTVDRVGQMVGMAKDGVDIVSKGLALTIDGFEPLAFLMNAYTDEWVVKPALRALGLPSETMKNAVDQNIEFAEFMAVKDEILNGLLADEPTDERGRVKLMITAGQEKLIREDRYFAVRDRIR